MIIESKEDTNKNPEELKKEIVTIHFLSGIVVNVNGWSFTNKRQISRTDLETESNNILCIWDIVTLP